jgi:hypothetical protein
MPIDAWLAATRSALALRWASRLTKKKRDTFTENLEKVGGPLPTLNGFSALCYSTPPDEKAGVVSPHEEPRMQIGTRSTPEALVKERTETPCLPCCPVCSGSLVPLHNAYRCARCSYYLCVGCEQIETGSSTDD